MYVFLFGQRSSKQQRDLSYCKEMSASKPGEAPTPHAHGCPDRQTYEHTAPYAISTGVWNVQVNVPKRKRKRAREDEERWRERVEERTCVTWRRH